MCSMYTIGSLRALHLRLHCPSLHVPPCPRICRSVTTSFSLHRANSLTCLTRASAPGRGLHRVCCHRGSQAASLAPPGEGGSVVGGVVPQQHRVLPQTPRAAVHQRAVGDVSVCEGTSNGGHTSGGGGRRPARAAGGRAGRAERRGARRAAVAARPAAPPRAPGQPARLVQAVGLAHGALDVQALHVLPVLLQQRHQEVDGHLRRVGGGERG